MGKNKNKNKGKSEADGAQTPSGNPPPQQLQQPRQNPQPNQQGSQQPPNNQGQGQSQPKPQKQQQGLGGFATGACGPQVQQQVAPPPGLAPNVQTQPQLAPAPWGPPQNAPGSGISSMPPQQRQPSGEAAPSQVLDSQPKQKVKGNKYPKKKEAPPPVEPAPGPSHAQQQQELPQIENLTVSPTRALQMIESSPDGTVYQGTRGIKCNLEVNYLQILVDKLIPKAFHYDVEFIPDIPKKMLSKALDKFMSTYFKGVHFAFDGRKNFYTNQLLKVKGVILDGSFEQEVEAVLGDRTKMFKVKVKFATEVDMSVLRVYQQKQFQHNDKPSQAIQCLDIILRTAFKSFTAINQAVAVGRALYFATEGRSIDLGEGMELWLGLFQSAILGRRSLFLNVDVAHKAFPSAVSLLQFLAALNYGKVPTTLDDRQQRQLNEYLKMLTISYRPNSHEPAKTYGYNALVQSARKATFVDADGVKMTVLEYFERKKRVRLQYPDLPCLHVGSKIRNIYMPLEFCEIPAGQATNKKCSPKCVASMIKYSATSTEVRKKKIMELLNKINYAKSDGEIKGFGIDVDKKFQNVEGRVIAPPIIKYSDGTAQPRAGVWNGKKFLETQNEQIKWAIINCDSRTTIQSIAPVKNNLASEANKQRMNLANFNSETDYKLIDMRDIEKQLTIFSQAGYKLVFVIIVDHSDCYAKVKQAAELKVGILTQCIKSNTIFRMSNDRNPLMTIGNILLKVNAKLNGKNHEVVEKSYQSLNSLADGVMFVGADVTHPSPDQRDIPSVVGVAASHDQVGFRYQCAWRLQDPKKEIIEDLKAILTEQLKFYQNKNGGKLPGKIMYYRDGVSDGQFAEVLHVEMTSIRGAMQAVYGLKPKAKVTFVVVQKRHHTRFFPLEQRFSEGKNQNIMAGTVVDKDIVHPFQYQFFMASHAAIQGVTKPTKYCVLINESKISPDDLQAMTYDLCHLFTRCNRSVSYPAPTYYAHLVAARGKQYIIGARLNMMNLKKEFESRLIRPNITNNCPMFFV